MTDDRNGGIVTERVLQRVIFPTHGDPESLPLFMDVDDWAVQRRGLSEADRLARARGVARIGGDGDPLRLTNRNALAWIAGRRTLRLPAFATVSLASYFNAFPASYWNRSTSLDAVRLRVATSGPGRVLVYRSNARSIIQSIQTSEVDGDSTLEFEIPFTSFIDGGWIWFDLQAGESPLTLVEAEWLAPESAEPRIDGSLTVSITTLNRGEYCSRLLAELGSDEAVTARIDRVLVVDQGSKKLRDDPGFPAAEAALGEKLRVIEQANLGGSGGFSRGMLETLDAGASDYVLLLDDDVEIEPESVRRALVFADFCREPTIVGGHMFDMYAKSKLHAFAEGVQAAPFMWGPVTPMRHDFSEVNLRQTPWLHRRYDVDYNGWWMSLIPVEIIRRIGLSLPVFIKWDDAEYGLRARSAGFATVSLPGAAVWHVSWVDKDDTHDWQAFFHARNRLVAALLHSPFKRGGKILRASIANDLKELLTMHYYTVAARQEAMRNALEGPEQLHRDMRDRLPRVRELQARFGETQLIRDTGELPQFPARVVESVMTGQTEAGPSGLRMARWLGKHVMRSAFRKPRGVEHAQAHLPFEDARWFNVPNYDSVLITNAEGSGVSWNRRNPALFRRLLAESVRLHARTYRRWPKLARRYRSQLATITSSEEWRRSLIGD